MKPIELPPHAQLMQFILGKWISKPIYVAAELGIADMLTDGPKSVDDLARMSETHAPSLYRLMRALAAVGIFSETNGKCFELTPMAECLKTGAMRPVALMFHSDWHDKAWDNLLYGVKTGEAAFDNAHGMPLFEWFKENPSAAKIYNEANALKAGNSHRIIVDAYDFSGINTLTDVGGGTGALLAEILNAYPSMHGVVADISSVVRQAKTKIQATGLGARCTTVECDFFNAIPAGSDAYLMSHILHDWNDTQCKTILNNCHKAMQSGSRLLIVEAVIPAGNEFSIGKLLDLEVFVMGGGRERTEAEFRNLLESCGFQLSQIIPTAESISVIEAVRI
jgi:ubiquinone/menaquinone biosynthesis C-methylase UbiE